MMVNEKKQNQFPQKYHQVCRDGRLFRVNSFVCLVSFRSSTHNIKCEDSSGNIIMVTANKIEKINMYLMTCACAYDIVKEPTRKFLFCFVIVSSNQYFLDQHYVVNC
uniref:Uncharacterized protein n=1 Tax=Glossina austeni TaxID=7395 RepID=A0A1A9USL5_GLOAU